MSQLSFNKYCVECHGKVTMDHSAYVPRLINSNGHFFESLLTEKEKSCSVCGLVHNFSVACMKSKKTFGDIIKGIRQDPAFYNLDYKDRVEVLRKTRGYWNEHYKEIDRRQDVKDLLNFIHQNID